MTRALLIYNPAAGQRDQRAAIDAAVAHLRSRDWQVIVRQTRGRGDATTYAREAAADQMDVVLAAGGDGTINEALNGLAYTNVALGVLPIGTANVWAQEIGLPVPRLLSAAPDQLLTSVRRLADGTVRT